MINNSLSKLNMKQTLTNDERDRLNQKIKEAEKSTGSQIVMATVKRSDSYAEIPWIAFAFGTSITGLLLFLIDLLAQRWVSDSLVLISVVIPLAVGFAFAILSILSPFTARIFLSKNRKEVETKQYAESLFLNRELYSTTGRRGVLMLVSQFERQVIILPDKGLQGYLNKTVLEKIIIEMAPMLRQGKLANSLEKGLSLLTAEFPLSSDIKEKNELPDEIIEEEGA